MQLTAAHRLTAWYLVLIMALSIGFSIFLFNVASANLNHSLRRPPMGMSGAFLDQFDSQFETYENLRVQRVHEAEASIIGELVWFNIGVLVIGGFVSFVLARRTIAPIEEALESQTRFTADASHELRTPLAAMQTEIEVALRDKHTTVGDSRQVLESNLEEITKLRQLIDGLLRLARNGSAIVPTEHAHLDAMVNDAVERTRVSARAKHITVRSDVKAWQLRADAANLTEALVILIDNAIRYSPAKTIVEVTAKRDGGHVLVKVRDHGPGIAAADVEHIFDRFYRGDVSRTKNHTEGFGLGLSIAQQIVRAHGGSLSYAAAEGGGAAFTIRLPGLDK